MFLFINSVFVNIFFEFREMLIGGTWTKPVAFASVININNATIGTLLIRLRLCGIERHFLIGSVYSHGTTVDTCVTALHDWPPGDTTGQSFRKWRQRSLGSSPFSHLSHPTKG